MNGVVAVVLLCLYGALVACVEIEIEGAHGWAELLPTWYRVSGPISRLYGILSGGRPLTGYHLFMVPALFASFHLSIAFGVHWSFAWELTIIAVWAAWVPYWDVLWFILNPAYGLRGFRPGRVWWHRNWLGPLPTDYVVGVALSIVLAGAASVIGDSADALLDQLLLLGSFAACVVLAILLAPNYHRWYRHTHHPGFDEREGVDRRAAPPSD